MADKDFRLTVHGAPGAKFDPEKSGVLTVKKTPSGHLLVKPLLAGEDFGWFIFDTGAGHTCFDKARRRKAQDDAGRRGAGRRRGGERLEFADRSRPGPAARPDHARKAARRRPRSAAHRRAMGEKISGIVGYPLLQSAIVEIDSATPAITIHNPPKFTLPADGQWQKLIIDNLHPMVEARYEGDRTGWFLMDTGMADSVGFYSPAVRKYKLLEGRKTRLTLCRAASAGWRRPRPARSSGSNSAGTSSRISVSILPAAKGAFANEYADGNLGQAVFMPFRLVFDFGNERLSVLEEGGAITRRRVGCNRQQGRARRCASPDRDSNSPWESRVFCGCQPSDSVL